MQIKDIEDVFFDLNSPRYADIELFSEIFKILDIPDFKKNQPDIHKYELMRIRDLHNSFITAYEKGYKQGRMNIQGKIEVAKKMLKKGLEVSLISEETGLTEREIIKLKQ